MFTCQGEEAEERVRLQWCWGGDSWWRKVPEAIEDVESSSRVEISAPKPALVVVCAHWSQFTQKGMSLAAGRKAVHTGDAVAAGTVAGKADLTKAGLPSDWEAMSPVFCCVVFFGNTWMLSWGTVWME